MTGEKSLELHHAALVAQLNTAEHRVVNVSEIIRVAVAALNNTAVHAGGIAVPDLSKDLGDGLACIDVDNLDVQGQRNTGLFIDNVLANQFTLNPVGALRGFGCKDAACVAREQDRGVGSGSDRQVGVMVGVENILEGARSQDWLVCSKGQSVSCMSIQVAQYVPWLMDLFSRRALTLAARRAMSEFLALSLSAQCARDLL